MNALLLHANVSDSVVLHLDRITNLEYLWQIGRAIPKCQHAGMCQQPKARSNEDTSTYVYFRQVNSSLMRC